MNKYLTLKNIVIGIVAISIVMILILLFTRSPKPADNSEAIKVLQEHNARLKAENDNLKAQYERQTLETVESKKADSALLKKYEARIWQDYQTIQQLKNKRDEKNKRIDSYDSDSLRRAFTEL